MKSLLLNIKNILTYLMVIAIYFFLVNIEARNDKNNYRRNKILENENKSKERKIDIDVKNQRVSIPVIPFNQ